MAPVAIRPMVKRSNSTTSPLYSALRYLHRGIYPTRHISKQMRSYSMRKKASRRKARDPTPVKIEPARELEYWTEKFRCTEQQLQKAVKKVGSNFEAVRAELARKLPLQLPQSRMKYRFAKSQAEQMWHL